MAGQLGLAFVLLACLPYAIGEGGMSYHPSLGRSRSSISAAARRSMGTSTKECRDMYKLNLCADHKRKMGCSDYNARHYCMKTCNLCDDSNNHRTSVIETKGTSCRDDKSECEVFAEEGLCKKERKIMNKYCKKSCNAC